MQYVVTARPIVAEMASFWSLLNDGTINAQKPDGAEIVASMKRAVIGGGKVSWYETCFCSPPLHHERSTVYDRFFTDMKIEPGVGPAIVEARKVPSYRFKPSGRTLWVVKGRKGEYQVMPESMFCTCDDYYFRVMDNKKQLCYHLVAQQIAEALSQYGVLDFADSQYA